MKVQLVLLALLVGTGAAWQDCTKTCSNIKNKRPCLKQSKDGCCVFNRRRRKCVDWPACKALMQQDCKRDPTCLWSWAGNTNDWAEDQNLQSRKGSCIDQPEGYDKSECRWNTQRGCQNLPYCKWRLNQNKKGGKCILNGKATGSPTSPTEAPTRSPTAQPTAQPTEAPTAQPTAPYAGAYTENAGQLVTTTGSTQKCGGNNQVTGQTLAQRANCEAACDACSACVGYNWERTGRASDGAGIYRCVYKKVTTMSPATADDAFYVK